MHIRNFPRPQENRILEELLRNAGKYLRRSCEGEERERERDGKEEAKQHVARGDPYAICLPHFRLLRFAASMGFAGLFFSFFFTGRLPNEGGRGRERSNKMKHIFYTNRRCSQVEGRIASR